MKRLVLILVLFFCGVSLAQKTQIDSLMIVGNDAFANSEFELAQKSFVSVLSLDEDNQQALYNLGLIQVNYGDKNFGCELLQKSYSVGDFGAYEMIIKYCGELEYNEKMYLPHVDELPKFKIKESYEPIIIGRSLNPKFAKLLSRGIRRSERFQGFTGQVRFNFTVDRSGKFDSRVYSYFTESQKYEFERILANMTEYQPAMHQGKAVDLIPMELNFKVIIK